MRKLFLIFVLTATYGIGNAKPIHHSPVFNEVNVPLAINDDNVNAIYNNAGVLVAWINGDIIYDSTGRDAIAFIDNQKVISFSNDGKYLGRFHNGFFRDKVGNAVAWIKGATGGPITPIPLERITPVFMPVVKPITPVLLPMVDPIESLGWSVVNWGEFVK
ncbi:4-fold beta flower protein [Mucilaginibacter dorajii]|uniref:4-fold beta flower domain-containing protein n=1 Tax=Mucilaginibacter dorajii TaxID=692994 RepID=A0ABP7Q0P1_9SPHI|nr:hypothetical protein [Mucilaginibacter dorajii]MCS3732877.1 hypothetical protein [Mucilaginibacter dorajii]